MIKFHDIFDYFNEIKLRRLEKSRIEAEILRLTQKQKLTNEEKFYLESLKKRISN